MNTLKNYQKSIFLTMILFFSVYTVLAQNTITGKIVDAKTDKPVSYVNIFLLRQSDSVLVANAPAGDNGDFKLVSVPNGSYRLVTSFIGYETLTQSVEVNKDINLGTLKITPGATTIGEVVVKGERPLFAVDGEKMLYNTAEDPSVQTGTASDVLQNSPGVSVDVEGNVTLRGTSSVEIWINDKPSHLTSENLKTYLQQMPANSIDHVEVITNPSARYGSKADGIINIVTTTKVKKNQFFSFGTNASIRPYVSPWVSYVWSNEKLSINLYSNFSYSLNKYNNISDVSLFGYMDGEQRQLISFERDTSLSKSNNYSGGLHFSMNYDIDSMNSISLWSGFWPNSGKSNHTEDYYRNTYFPYEYNTNYHGVANSESFSYWGGLGLYYRHKFDQKGHNLSFDLNGSSWAYNNDNYHRRSVFPADYIRTLQTDSKSMQFDVSAEIRYDRPYSDKGEISVGYYGSLDFSKYSRNVDSLRDETWITDEMRTYRMTSPTIDNHIFFTLEQKFGNFTIKPGVRFEHEYIMLNYPDELTDTFNIKKHFFHVRPSLHLSYRTESMHNFRLSYSFRSSTPSAEQLTKYCDFSEEGFSSGNPLLKNIFTHSLEAGWSKYWNKFGSVGATIYFRAKSREVNEIAIPMYHDYYGRIVTYEYPINVGKSTSTGLEFNTMYRPNAMLNIRFYANVYHSYLETIYNSELVKSSLWSYSFDLSLWTKLWKRLEITASGTYRSPSQTLFSISKPYYGINAGLRVDFFDHKLSLYLNVTDIFNWNKWGSDVESPYLVSHSTFKYNSRTVSAGFTLRFGKMELEHQARQGGGSAGGGQGSTMPM